MTKLERIRNYFIRTNTDDNTTVEYPAFEARYRLSEDSYFLTSINDASIGEYFKFADLLDGDGNAWTDQATLNDWLRINTGAEIPTGFPFSVSSGTIDGVSHINKFGANIDITKDVEEDVWDGGGVYNFPTTATITDIHQATDQVAMRGGTIEVQGLDADWNDLTQNIDLDATDSSTLVKLDTPLIRVFRLKVLENVVADSDISVTNAADTINYAIMTAGNNQTLMAIYTVPANKTAYLTNYYGTTIDATNKTPTATIFRLWAADRANNYEFQLKHVLAIPKAGNQVTHDFIPFGSVGEKTDIKITAEPIDQGANVAAGFDLILEDN